MSAENDHTFEGNEAIKAAEVNEAVKVSKAMKITIEVFRVLGLNNIIQWKISLYFDVSNKKMLVES